MTGRRSGLRRWTHGSDVAASARGNGAIPAFTHVVVVPPGSTTVYIGGQNAVDGDGTLVGGDDVAAQTRQVMKNLHIALAAAGAAFRTW